MSLRIVALVASLSMITSLPIASAHAAAPEPAAVPTAAPAPAPAPTATPVTTATPPANTAPVTGTWDDEPAPPPQPAVAPTSVPPADVPPPRPPRNRAGLGLIIGGVSLVGVGAVSLLFVAAPAAIVKRVALDRAERDTAIGFSSRRDRYRRARAADNTMEGAFWVGISALAVGTTFAIIGGVLKSRARSRAMARLGGGPGGLSVRF